jgi:hypothetical protein
LVLVAKAPVEVELGVAIGPQVTPLSESSDSFIFRERRGLARNTLENLSCESNEVSVLKCLAYEKDGFHRSNGGVHGFRNKLVGDGEEYF